MKEEFEKYTRLHYRSNSEIAALVKAILYSFIDQLMDKLEIRGRKLRGVFIEISGRVLRALRIAHEERNWRHLCSERKEVEESLEQDFYGFYLQDQTVAQILEVLKGMR
ncbi:hypothetical protein ACFL21_00750 [Patescibacteria group bacterium]